MSLKNFLNPSFSLDFQDLYAVDGLEKIHKKFLEFLQENAPEYFLEYQIHNAENSQYLIEIAKILEIFLVELFLIHEKNSELKKSPPHALITFFREKIHLSKRVKSAILAFPFPFGMVGLHRIYLGAKPYVPVAYIATLGGVFGILPLIDFCTILFHKDFDHYQNNGQVFMWINE